MRPSDQASGRGIITPRLFKDAFQLRDIPKRICQQEHKARVQGVALLLIKPFMYSHERGVELILVRG